MKAKTSQEVTPPALECHRCAEAISNRTTPERAEPSLTQADSERSQMSKDEVADLIRIQVEKILSKLDMWEDIIKDLFFTTMKSIYSRRTHQ